MKTKFFLLSAIILSVFLVVLAYYDYLKEYGKSIHIAFVGPLSGEGAAAGRLMTQAIELYLDKINKRGGVNGKKIILDKFDDQNDCKGDTPEAKKKALQIVKENKAIAVIGHWFSSCSITGGEVYKKHKIPAITPGSTSLKVTDDNEWYFRTIYNAKTPGQFLANYVKQVFLQNNVNIISEKAAYGSYLAKEFEQESRKLDMQIKNHWRYDNNDKHLKSRFKKIIAKLKEKEAEVILLAVQATEGVELVRLIKDAGIRNIIIGGSSLSEETFLNGFEAYPISKQYPGHYTNDIYVATPLIFDTANKKAQQFFKHYKTEYNEEPDWSAAYAYDTVMILVEAIKQAEIQGTQEAITTDRQKIRDTLASFNSSYNALEGVTGFNYFKNRDAQKTVSLGVYKHRQLVSALTQLQIVRNPNKITKLKQAPLKKHVLQINDRYMYKTNVVYVGLDIIEISDIEIKKLQFTLEFKLWFRFAGDFNPQNLEFSNALDHVSVRQQLQKSCQSKNIQNIIYTVCRIKSRFRADFVDKFYIYKQHTVGVKFRHRTSSRQRLIYVTDILGMGLLTTEKTLAKRLTKSQAINPAEGWKIKQVWFFPEIVEEYSAGDPKFLNEPEGQVEYSQFNAVIQIKRDQWTLRGIIPYKYAYHIMVLSGFSFLILTLTGGIKKIPKLTWFLQVIFAGLLLLSGEIIFADWLTENTGLQQKKYIIMLFDILWLVIPAFLINLATKRFVWSPLEKKIGRIPRIIPNFFALVVYFIAIIGIIVFVYEQRFTSLLAASGVIAMIIGLAIQINISNVFAGIVINMERPFRIGDWIKVGKFNEGEVIDINWRATQLKERNGCILSIPNSTASESAIINFHYPKESYWLWPTVYVHPRHSPIQVKKILLDALLSANKILKEPEPIVFFTGINEWAACYWIAFCAEDYADKFFILEDVWTRVWFHLNRANLVPAVMRQEFHIFSKGEKGMVSSSTTQPNSFGPALKDMFSSSPKFQEDTSSKQIPAHKLKR